MSQIIATQFHEGVKYIILHVYLKSDGQSGDLDSAVLIDRANENMGDYNKFVIDNVTWSFNGFAAKLHFELLVSDKPAWVFSPSAGNFIDFTKYGGIYDRGSLLDTTGKLLLTTTAFIDDGDEGSMMIRIRKHT